MLTLRLLGGHVLEGVSLECADTQNAVYKKDGTYCLIPRTAIVCVQGDKEAFTVVAAAQGCPELPDSE